MLSVPIAPEVGKIMSCPSGRRRTVSLQHDGMSCGGWMQSPVLVVHLLDKTCEPLGPSQISRTSCWGTESVGTPYMDNIWDILDMTALLIIYRMQASEYVFYT
jgi:hypothetical protein